MTDPHFVRPYIIVSRIFHRDAWRLLLSFGFNIEIADKVKSINGRRYSKTHKAWHIPLNSEGIKAFLDLDLPYQLDASMTDEHIWHDLVKDHVSDVVDEQQYVREDAKIGYIVDLYPETLQPSLRRYLQYLRSNHYSWNGILYRMKIIDRNLVVDKQIGQGSQYTILTTPDSEEERTIMMQYKEFQSTKA